MPTVTLEIILILHKKHFSRCDILNVYQFDEQISLISLCEKLYRERERERESVDISFIVAELIVQ